MARRTVAAPEPPPPPARTRAVGTPTRAFSVQFRGSLLRFMAGQRFAADAQMRAFFEAAEMPVEWTDE